MTKIANISHGIFISYTGTGIPINYKFVCWVGDENEKELLKHEEKQGREIIQIEINE